MKKQYTWSLLLLAALLVGCEAFVEKDVSIPGLPEAPTFELTPTADNPNRIIIKDMSQGFFSRVWDAPGGTPASSTLTVDTILFTKAGTYTITLHAAKEGGGGTASASQQIVIAEDAAVSCTDDITLLAGGCEIGEQKCWTFSSVAGAITVGPTPGSGEWFTSPQDGLDFEQYNDDFCFSFDGAKFVYKNQGKTVDPWNGYVPVDYIPPDDYTWLLVPGAGENGEIRIQLPEGAFMGVWDSGPAYDIVSLSEETLVVRSKIVGVDGWFELTFVAN
ncbi:MAG: hypothetical protein HRU41_11905 [Saprospiraceae bacterium]|nr:hypothetical protein [Saprospiraceae bacterium]